MDFFPFIQPVHFKAPTLFSLILKPLFLLVLSSAFLGVETMVPSVQQRRQDTTITFFVSLFQNTIFETQLLVSLIARLRHTFLRFEGKTIIEL